jgi:hypothetical protein
MTSIDVNEGSVPESSSITEGHAVTAWAEMMGEISEPVPGVGSMGKDDATENESNSYSWSQWTWNAELGLYIIFYEECYHTWDPEKQVYGKYTEEDDGQREDSQSNDDEDDDNIDGEPMSDPELDGEPLEPDDFQEGVSDFQKNFRLNA